MSFFYLLLTLFIHGRKATMKNVLGILFGLLFLLGLGRMAFLWNNDYAGKWNQLVTSLNTSSTGDTTPLTGDNNWTGTSALTGGDLTGSVLPPVGTGNTVTTPTKEGLTYGQLVPYIVEKYGLSAAGKPDVGFTYLTANDERYQAFKAGHYNKFFSTTINPNSQVTCDTYVIFIGLAEQWDLSYTAENVHEVFWNEAQNKGILYGCKKGEFVRWANLF